MYVCRDAEVEPALPTRVSAVATVTCVDAQLGADDLRLDGDESLPDLGGGGVHDGGRLAADDLQPDAGGGVVVEALREADVLDADAIADAAADPSPCVVLATPPGSSRRSRRVARRRQRRSRTRSSSSATGAGRVDAPARSAPGPPRSSALRTRISTGSSPSAAASLSICDS